MISRRNLLQGIFAAGIAPAIVKAEILMPVRKIIVPELGIQVVKSRDDWQTDLSRWYREQLDSIMHQAMNPPLIVRNKDLFIVAPGQNIQWSQLSNPHSFQVLLKGRA